MRIMAVDFGDAHTGISVSDPTGMIAGSAWVIDERDFDSAAEKIAAAAAENSAEKIVLGCPRNMDGSLGPRAEKSMLLAEKLRELTALEVILWDERRTTVDAHRILLNVGKRGKKRKKTVDAVAASLILEGYLGSLK